MKVRMGRSGNSKQQKVNVDGLMDLVENMKKDLEAERNKPLATMLPEPTTIIEKHIKTVNVTHENTKTIDSRGRKYAKELRKQINHCHTRADGFRGQILEMHRQIVELQSRKPEEKQIVTIEKNNTETIKEIEYKLDKRILALLGLSLAMNILVLILK